MVKRALCCGLNYPKQKHQLYGCVNDCLNWDHVLRETFAFDEIRVLIDQHPDGSLATAATQIPTQENILAQLGWLCSGAECGDCLVFMYAGHGVQVRCPDGEIEEALVPEDFSTSRDENGNPPLVWNDELHALFARLPPGAFLTVILDCCHGSHMLDVPCSVDTTRKPPRVVQACERPKEVPGRQEEDWQKMLIPHALARPRFVPTITLRGPPRQRRTPQGSGAHAGRMTLDPGVTAFCFTAARTAETALDASIKAHQQGVMSFCLLEALQSLRHRCTYEHLLEKASTKMDDIREKYMPMMDQYIQLSFCPNSAPTEVVVLDALYARVAQHRLYQKARLEERGQSGDGRGALAPYAQGGADRPAPMNREASSDFVPSPMYHQTGSVQDRGGAHSNGLGPGPVVGYLYVRVHAGHGLKNTDTGIFGDVSDPYVKVKIGTQEERTPTIDNDLNPVWTSGNDFGFHVTERDTILELDVCNANLLKDDSLGKTHVDLHNLPPGQWHRRRDRLQSGMGELEFDIRLDRAQAQPPGGPGVCGAGACPAAAGNHAPGAAGPAGAYGHGGPGEHGFGAPSGGCPSAPPLSSAPYTQQVPPYAGGPGGPGGCPPHGGPPPYGAGGPGGGGPGCGGPGCGGPGCGGPPPHGCPPGGQGCAPYGGQPPYEAPYGAGPPCGGAGEPGAGAGPRPPSYGGPPPYNSNAAPPAAGAPGGPCAPGGVSGPQTYGAPPAGPSGPAHVEQSNPYMAPDPGRTPYPAAEGAPYGDTTAMLGQRSSLGSTQRVPGALPEDDSSNIFGRPNLLGGMPSLFAPGGAAVAGGLGGGVGTINAGAGVFPTPGSQQPAIPASTMGTARPQTAVPQGAVTGNSCAASAGPSAYAAWQGAVLGSGCTAAASPYAAPGTTTTYGTAVATPVVSRVLPSASPVSPAGTGYSMHGAPLGTTVPAVVPNYVRY